MLSGRALEAACVAEAPGPPREVSGSGLGMDDFMWALPSPCKECEVYSRHNRGTLGIFTREAPDLTSVVKCPLQAVCEIHSQVHRIRRGTWKGLLPWIRTKGVA